MILESGYQDFAAHWGSLSEKKTFYFGWRDGGKSGR